MYPHKKLSKIKKKVIKNLHIFMVFSGVIMLWRGVWSLADQLIVPEFRLFSSILSIVLGLCIVFLYRKNLKVLIR